MAIRLINPVDNSLWDSFILKHPLSSIYHHSFWTLLLKSTFRKLVPNHIASFDKHGEINGVLPSFISNNLFSSTQMVSLPLAAYCDPLFYSNDTFDQGLNNLIKKQQNENIKVIELHAVQEHSIMHDFKFKQLKYYLTHILKIDKNLEELNKSFHKTSVQQRINKSLNFNLNLKMGKDINDVKMFHYLEILNRRKIGLPPLPFKFFKNMWEIFYPKGLMSLLLVKYKNQYISGMILLKYKNCVYSEYTATDPGFLKLHPNHFIIWKAIELAHQEGYTYFDFGRSSIDNKGLIDFKKRWGAEEQVLYYYYFPEVQSISAESRQNLRFRLTKSICKKMPIRLLKISGDIVYQHLI